MYIEFRLPRGAGGPDQASHALSIVQKKLVLWAARYEVEYRTKVFKYTLRVTFNSDESYTLFAMTWVPHPDHPEWTSYRLVTDLNNKI
jgi:hypothetical protein